MRELIPSEFLSPYVCEQEDLDDDYLPDVWEQAMGLDATDNGRVDVLRQGERGDYDSDGLSNRQEFVLGTDPTRQDTDGDGLTDLEEQRVHHTDPTVSDAAPESVVDDVDLTQVDGYGER